MFIDEMDSNTLMGLSKMMNFVSETLGMDRRGRTKIPDRQTFDRLEQYLFCIHEALPKHRGATEASVLLLSIAIGGIETVAETYAKKGEWPFSSPGLEVLTVTDPDEVIAGTQSIRGLFCLRFIGNDFYEPMKARILAAYETVIDSPVPHGVKASFTRHHEAIERNLLKRVA